jgi:hypothetical protein
LASVGWSDQDGIAKPPALRRPCGYPAKIFIKQQGSFGPGTPDFGGGTPAGLRDRGQY